MAKLTDDVDYDAGGTFENVSSPLSDAGNHENYYGRRLRTRCVILSHPDNKIKLRQGQPTSKIYYASQFRNFLLSSGWRRDKVSH
ncbi:unnamed protein product [Protopolystoma xenopodis]|uniref:Uncharacterized protein n=1 Tax=Protopolystoma xenopodis TaxID=117903 RepID=A0A448WHC3_9PLAT|nr:unnamed protein product [Protopolystoma xenopodis]